jgi:hypothetical protein
VSAKAEQGKKRGPKGIQAVMDSNKQLKTERDEYARQLSAKELDVSSRLIAEHTAVVQRLEGELDEKTRTLSKREGADRRAIAAADAAHAELAAAKILHEGAMMDLEKRATKAYNHMAATKQRMIDTRDEKLARADELSARLLGCKARCDAAELLAAELPELKARLLELESQLEERKLTIKRLCGMQGGRPCLSRKEEELKECSQSQAWQCEKSMSQRVLEVIGQVGTESQKSTSAIMEAIERGGYLDLVWESEIIWRLRMEWMAEKRDDLAIAWDANLSMKIRDKLVISYDKVDELRFMLSHHRVGKQLKPRTWVVNPHDGTRLPFPQPIRPRNGAMGWTKLVAAAQARYGLTMDSKGRIAQRSYKDTVTLQLARDEARGLLRPITKSDPLVVVLGADGTGIGKRSMMHVATSIAPSYREGVSVENEKNICTIAASVTDDHWGGLNETLCGGCYTGDCAALPPASIASELNALVKSKSLTIEDRQVPVAVRGCFDLVAARGIRGGRGRCACHTETATADRFKVPLITDSMTWEAAKAQLDKVPLLTATKLRDDSHTPPEDWDYSQHPWRCPRAGCIVEFKSNADFLAARKSFLVAKADKSADGKKAAAARAKRYAEFHPSEQGEFEPPLTDMNMIDVAIDPLHCLLLNLPKVVWKYVFGDRMTNEQRELVAEYLTSIGCPLDVRAKGDGRDCNRKWFTGEIFQRFVEGDAEGNSPGLAENIKAIMDIIYLKAPAPVAAVAAAAPATANPHANKTARNGGGGSKKRAGGFTFVPIDGDSGRPGAGAVSAPKPPAVSPADDTPTDAKLRERYGSHMDIVKLGLAAWQEIGLTYAEWREPWTSRSKEYAEQRALQLLRCTVRLSEAMKAASIGKHKSWYTYLAVWVVPRQMARDGDLWALGTSPVEQRGARLKKFVRNVVSWRPYHDGWVAPSGPAEADGTIAPVFVARRKYESCAMMQVLRMCVAQEEMWAAPALERARSGTDNLSVSERRMQTVGRTSLLKIERGKGLRLPALKEEIIDLT